MKIETINTANNWIKNLKDFNHSIFIRPEWLESLSANNYTPIYLDFYSDSNLIGKLAGLIINKGNIRGKQLYFYAGPAIINPDTSLLNKCNCALHSFAKKEHYSRIIIGSYDQAHSLKIKNPNFFSTVRKEYVIDLNSDIKFKSRFKRNTKKASKFIDLTEINRRKMPYEMVIALLSRTLEYRQNKKRKAYDPFYLPYWSPNSLEKLLNSDLTDFFVIHKNDTTHCFEINLKSGKRVFNLLRAADDAAYTNGLPSYIGKRMIEEYTSNHFNSLNLGGIPSGSDGTNLAVYKKSMGAKEITVYGATTNYITYPYKLLNPILNLGRLLPDIGAVNFFKKFI